MIMIIHRYHASTSFTVYPAPSAGTFPLLSVSSDGAALLKHLNWLMFQESMRRQRAQNSSGGGNNTTGFEISLLQQRDFLLVNVISGEFNPFYELYTSVAYAVVMRTLVPVLYLVLVVRSGMGIHRWRSERRRNPIFSRVPLLVFIDLVRACVCGVHVCAYRCGCAYSYMNLRACVYALCLALLYSSRFRFDFSPFGSVLPVAGGTDDHLPGHGARLRGRRARRVGGTHAYECMDAFLCVRFVRE